MDLKEEIKKICCETNEKEQEKLFYELHEKIINSHIIETKNKINSIEKNISEIQKNLKFLKNVIALLIIFIIFIIFLFFVKYNKFLLMFSFLSLLIIIVALKNKNFYEVWINEI